MAQHDRNSAFLIALLPAVAACGSGDGSNAIRDASAQRATAPPPPSVAFRLPPRPGPGVRLYTLPALEEMGWNFETSTLAVERVVGHSADEDVVFLQTADGALVALDLVSGSDATLDSAVIGATLGPTGTPHFVRTDGSVGVVQERRTETWTPTLATLPSTIWGTTRGRLLMLLEDADSRRLAVVNDEEVAQVSPIPDGLLATTAWADVAAIAVDSGVITLDPVDGRTTAFRKMRDEVTAMAFSRAGHRLYAATVAGELLVLNRFGLNVVARHPLPHLVEAFRAGSEGRVVLMKPVDRDSVWITLPPDFRTVRSVPGRWEPDLPTVAPDGTVLIRREDDVIAFDARNGTETARVEGAAEDRWLIVQWDARRPTLQLAREEEREAPVPTDQLAYVQLTSTANQTWAQARVDELREAGLNALALAPTEYDDRYRVVLGPYRTRAQADDIGRRLGQPYFIIFLRDTTGTNP